MGAWVFVFLVLIYILLRFLRRDDSKIVQPRKSFLAEGLMPFSCETCHGTGGVDITAPWRDPTATNYPAMVNFSTCTCCQGLSVHWIPHGGKWKCKRYVQYSGRDTAESGER